MICFKAYKALFKNFVPRVISFKSRIKSKSQKLDFWGRLQFVGVEKCNALLSNFRHHCCRT
jgi:uncharacterized protein YaaR (DUF327 family)